MAASVQMAEPDTCPPVREPGVREPGVREQGATTSVRRCIASGELRPKAELIRFVADPGGTVVPDLAGRLPGRGGRAGARRREPAARAGPNLITPHKR